MCHVCTSASDDYGILFQLLDPKQQQFVSQTLFFFAGSLLLEPILFLEIILALSYVFFVVVWCVRVCVFFQCHVVVCAFSFIVQPSSVLYLQYCKKAPCIKSPSTVEREQQKDENIGALVVHGWRQDDQQNSHGNTTWIGSSREGDLLSSCNSCISACCIHSRLSKNKSVVALDTDRTTKKGSARTQQERPLRQKGGKIPYTKEVETNGRAQHKHHKRGVKSLGGLYVSTKRLCCEISRGWHDLDSNTYHCHHVPRWFPHKICQHTWKLPLISHTGFTSPCLSVQKAKQQHPWTLPYSPARKNKVFLLARWWLVWDITTTSGVDEKKGRKSNTIHPKVWKELSHSPLPPSHACSQFGSKRIIEANTKKTAW